MGKENNNQQAKNYSLKLNSLFHFNPLLVISTALCLTLSQAYAMYNDDDDWETSPDASSHQLNPKSHIDDDDGAADSLSAEKMRALAKELWKRYDAGSGKPNQSAPHKSQNLEQLRPGKVKVPESLLPFFEKRVAQPQEKKEQEQQLYITVPSQPTEETPSTSSQKPGTGLIKSEKGEETLRRSPSSFEEKIQDVTLRANTLKALGLQVNEDNIASFFLEPDELYTRLVDNFHGPVLVHDRADLNSIRSLPIFNGLVHTKSVKVLSLKEAFLKNTSYLALGTALAHNRSLKRLDLTGVSWTPEALSLLGTALQDQKTLREIILSPKTSFMKADIENFYKCIESNQGLRLIVWPQTVKKAGFLGFTDSKQSTLEVLEELSRAGNRVAALHLGMMHVKGLTKERNLKKAFFYLERAHTLNHPLASFELGRLNEKQKSYEEALNWYRQAASQKIARAFAKVGDYYRAVWPVKSPLLQTPDYQNAFLSYTQGAQQEDAKCLYRLGRMHEFGKHGEISLPWAAYYYYQSSQWGYADAFIALGALYRNPQFVGTGDPAENENTAAYYLRWAERFPKAAGTAQRFLSYK